MIEGKIKQRVLSRMSDSLIRAKANLRHLGYGIRGNIIYRNGELVASIQDGCLCMLREATKSHQHRLKRAFHDILEVKDSTKNTIKYIKPFASEYGYRYEDDGDTVTITYFDDLGDIYSCKVNADGEAEGDSHIVSKLTKSSRYPFKSRDILFREFEKLEEITDAMHDDLHIQSQHSDLVSEHISDALTKDNLLELKNVYLPDAESEDVEDKLLIHSADREYTLEFDLASGNSNLLKGEEVISTSHFETATDVCDIMLEANEYFSGEMIADSLLVANIPGKGKVLARATKCEGKVVYNGKIYDSELVLPYRHFDRVSDSEMTYTKETLIKDRPFIFRDKDLWEKVVNEVTENGTKEVYMSAPSKAYFEQKSKL